MLKGLLYGAAAIFIGSKLKKMNDEGRLEPYKEQARKGAEQLKERLNEQKEKAGHWTKRKAPASAGDNLSKPAPPHPWPVDPKAMPSEG